MSPRPPSATGSPPNDSPGLVFFLLARGISSLSFQMLSVAVGWHVYKLTNSAFDLGLVGLAQFLPMICLTLLVGHVADRFDRRRIVAICMVIEALAALLLGLGVFEGWLTRDGVYLLVAIGGSARAFEAPTVTTLLPALVPRTRLQRATAWSASSNQTAQILGPALGGVAYALSPVATFVLVGVLFGVSASCASCLRLAVRPPARAPTTLASIFSGIHFIRRTPVMLGTISLDLFAVLLGGATALLPVYARDILHTGPWGLGMLRAAPGLGALMTSLVLARRPLAGPVGKILFGSVLTFGAATITFGLSRSLPFSMLTLVLLGASDSVGVVVRNTLVQLRTPDAMLGRVSAVTQLFTGTSNQLGEFESGSMAALVGSVPAVVLGGLGTIAIGLLWMVLFPALREIRSLDGNEPTPPLETQSSVVEL